MDRAAQSAARPPSVEDTAIAAARAPLSPAGWPYWIAIGVLATSTALLGILLGVGHEVGLVGAGGVYGALGTALGADAMRVIAAVSVGLAVLAVAEVGRGLLRSRWAGLLAAALVGSDPGVLVWAQSTAPHAVLLALAAAGTWCAVRPSPVLAWGVGVPLAGAAAIDPRMSLAAVPLFLLVAFRGQIYIAPRHLAIAAAQTLTLPAAAAVLATAAARHSGALVHGCGTVWRQLIHFDVQVHDGLIAIGGPMLWWGGAFATLALGGGVAATTLHHGRVARQPGRLQARLAGPLTDAQAQAAWLVCLAIFSLHPVVFAVPAALAIAHGVRQLARDGGGFGLATTGAVVVFAMVGLVRFWPLVVGDGGAASLADLAPWVGGGPCL